MLRGCAKASFLEYRHKNRQVLHIHRTTIVHHADQPVHITPVYQSYQASYKFKTQIIFFTK
ncbi:hypothetical protein BN132_3414 [Cronobacter turicensis 564]|nr:hypothetical protein BN132_3414 [Cronobacter turicensis 564]